MRRFSYIEADGRKEVEVTEQEILDQFYPWWAARLESLGRAHLISENNCINDFCVSYWAVELDTFEEK